MLAFRQLAFTWNTYKPGLFPPGNANCESVQSQLYSYSKCHGFESAELWCVTCQGVRKQFDLVFVPLHLQVPPQVRYDWTLLAATPVPPNLSFGTTGGPNGFMSSSFSPTTLRLQRPQVGSVRPRWFTTFGPGGSDRSRTTTRRSSRRRSPTARIARWRSSRGPRGDERRYRWNRWVCVLKLVDRPQR